MAQGLHEFTPAGKMKRAKFSEVCQWVVNAWAKIKVPTVENSFRKCGIGHNPPQGNPDLTEQSDEEDSDSDEEDHRPQLPQHMIDLFHSDEEDSDFDGFAESDIEADDTD